MNSKNNKLKTTKYSSYDTRYGFMIQDSNEYNTRIYPLGMKELCNKKSPRQHGHLISQAVGCVNERYENCIDLKEHNKEFAKCNFSVNNSTYDGIDEFADDIKDVLKYKDDDPDQQDTTDEQFKKTVLSKHFVPKKLNENVFIDKNRLSKIKYPNLEIDRSPDIYDINLGNLGKKKQQKELFENSGVQRVQEICKPIMTGCCPWCPDWMTPEYSCALCVCLCLFIILLPCICSCCGLCFV